MTDVLIPIDADPEAEPSDYLFWCPGCECGHFVRVRGKPQWTLTGTLERPTVSPSIRVRGGQWGADATCHLYIRDGQIEYLGDCTHALKGQTVPMVPP